MKRLWRDYNLSVVLGLLFVTSWIGQLITQWFNQLTALATMALVSGLVVVLIVLLNRVPHDTQ